MPDTPKFKALCLGLLLLSATVAGCSGSKIKRTPGVPASIEIEEVPYAIERAEIALAGDRPQEALDWMRAAMELRYMPTDQRAKVQRLLEVSADRMIQEMSDEDQDPAVLADILELDLPRQISVTGAIRAAEMMVRAGNNEDAVELIRKVDKLFPTHHMRPEAGRLLTEAGLALSMDDSGWFLSNPRNDAYAALEYVSIHYPSAPNGDLVLRRLAEMYEEDKDWQLAIARHEELVQNFPRSEMVPYSLARIPLLKLTSVERPEYDRGAILEARAELEEWLRDYPGHENTAEVTSDLGDALVRLSVSDLKVAKFYRKTSNPFGARFHAERALEEAHLAGDEGLAGDAQAILDSLPTPRKPR